MSSRSVARRRAYPLAIVILALLLAGCGATASPTATPASTAPSAAASTSAAPAASAAASASGQPAATTTRAASPAAVTYPLEITDATGKKFKFDKAPKVGCFWFGCTEIMADLGLTPHATGATEAQLASTFWFPSSPKPARIADSNNPEQWAAAGVDVIVTRGPASPASEALQTAAPVFYLHGFSSSNLTGLAEFVENTRIMGRLVGAPDKAEAAIARFDQVVANMKKVAPAGIASSTIAVIFTGEAYAVVTPDQPFCDVIAKNALGKCVAITPPGKTSSIEVNAEEFLKLNPTWVAIQGLQGTAGPESRKDPIWPQLTAVKEKKVYAAGNRYYCCSLRGLTHSLQEYGFYTFGPQANIPNPGPVDSYDPLKSPLVAR